MKKTTMIAFALGACVALSLAATSSGQLTGGGGLQKVIHTARFTGDGSTNVPLEAASTAVTPGSYTNTSLTVDAFGRLTAAANGGSTTVVTSSPIQGNGTGGSPVTLTNAVYGDITVTGGTTWTVGSLPESRITNLVSDLGSKVPTSTTITTTAPLTIDGGSSANLTTGRTLAVGSFSTSLSGVVNSSTTSTNFLRGDNTWSTVTQTTAALNQFTSSLQGMASASGAAANFLRGDNTWSTILQVTAALNTFTSSLQGLVPASGGGTTNFLRADGTWAAAGGGTLFAGAGEFGDGSDGSSSLSGAQTINGDKFFTTLTLASGTTLTCASSAESCRIFANVGIVVTSGTATIQVPGLAGSGSTGGAALSGGPVGGASGAGASGIQNAGQNAAAFSPGAWPTSFRAGAGGTGGTDGTTTHTGGTGSVANSILTDDLGRPNTRAQSELGAISMSNPGRLGGGGGGGSGGGTTGICSGGGGGSGGGVIIVGFRTLSGTLVVTAPGGVGGNTTGGAGCVGGGGGGGGGGYAIVTYGGSSQPGSLTISAPGGAGGLGGTALGLGGGATGATGGAGKTPFYPLGPS